MIILVISHWILSSPSSASSRWIITVSVMSVDIIKVVHGTSTATVRTALASSLGLISPHILRYAADGAHVLIIIHGVQLGRPGAATITRVSSIVQRTDLTHPITCVRQRKRKKIWAAVVGGGNGWHNNRWLKERGSEWECKQVKMDDYVET